MSSIGTLYFFAISINACASTGGFLLSLVDFSRYDCTLSLLYFSGSRVLSILGSCFSHSLFSLLGEITTGVMGVCCKVVSSDFFASICF